MSTIATWLQRCCVLLIVAAPTRGDARSLFVSHQGDDDQPGTIERPWKSLKASFARLEAGDTLNLRGGGYWEDGLILKAKGTPEQPIVIRAEPGSVWIGADGGVFIDGSDAWQTVDQDKKIYRLKKPPPSKVTRQLTGGWLWEPEVIQLLPYTNQKLFSSPNFGVGGYVGPGFIFDKGELRIRLQMPEIPADSSATEGRSSAIESNPDLHAFFFCSNAEKPGLTIRNAAYIVLENLNLEPAGRRTVEITGDSHHVTMSGCNVLVRTLGVVAQEGTHDLAIRDCMFRMGFPPWVAWGDVKGGSRGKAFNPAEEAGWNSFAVVGVWNSSVIERSTFMDCFDGIFLRSGSENVVISDNSIIRSRDDAIDLAPDVSKIDISHNVIWRCFEGISLVGEKQGKKGVGGNGDSNGGGNGASNGASNGGSNGGGDAGDVFIHHNVIDVSARHFAERKEDAAYFKSEWSPGIAFGRHDCGRECEDARWRLYNNTIVARGKNKTVPVDMPLAILTNNLIFDPDQKPDDLDCQRMERSSFTTPDEVRELYKPKRSAPGSQNPPVGSSSWPEFDPRMSGAIP
ncbi:MAG TPA: right-handed parallel beta-helix repeat-containing protein [bacterium]|nr:right-handed parallel beta-helix repeat-containing protein [bacterium]